MDSPYWKNLEGLDENELRIECSIRNIPYQVGDWIGDLMNCLAQEAANPGLKPSKCHSPAKVPRELKLCQETYSILDKEISQVAPVKDLARLNKLKTKVRHWWDRTFRLKGLMHQDNEVDLLINKWRRLRQTLELAVDDIVSSSNIVKAPKPQGANGSETLDNQNTNQTGAVPKKTTRATEIETIKLISMANVISPNFNNSRNCN